MPDGKVTWLAFCLFAAVVILFVMMATPGCRLAKNIDEAVWGSPATTQPGGTDVPTATRPGPIPTAPPIIEIIAALLAAGGFGGMAGWLRKIRRSANGRLDSLEERLKRLEGIDGDS